MRKFFGLVALLCACSSLFAQKTPPLGRERVLWLGDSITQAGDYVTIVEYYLNKQYPSDRFDIVSIGLSSENVSCLTEKDHPFPRPCLSERLGRALDLVTPQLVIACYGMNDGIYHPQSPERMAAFQKGIQGLIAAVRAKGARLILLTPPPFDPVPVAAVTRDASAPDFSYKAPYKRYDDVLADYAAWEKTLAAPDVTVIDLHTPMDAYIAKQRASNPQFSFTKDGIHPNLEGHLLMAQTILESFKMKFPKDSLSNEAARIQSDPIFVLVKSAREKLSQGWLDYVGYTRDKQVKGEYPTEANKAAQDIQQQIDIIRKN
ncbi:MAG TPA: SGNH/GDSL hydrolase family protein [Bryobacteraceae bacterium]|nr:SGNH/GDSL hydrolase family protein [Bryobacteraceae bacterium]